MSGQTARCSRLAVLLAFLVLAAIGPARGQDAVGELRELIERRLSLMEDVARSKWTTGGPIEDLPREAALLQAGDKVAAQAGLPADEVRGLLKAQIEAAKLVQRRWFALWQAEKAGPFEGGAELLAARRPEIAALSERLVPTYARARPALGSCRSRGEFEAVPPSLAVDSEAWRAAISGVFAVLPTCR
jgi:chorismate mutase